MAYTGIFATLLEVQYRVGANASTTANTETYINSYIAQVENLINVEVGVNFSSGTYAYSGLNAATKYLLTMAAAARTAMMVLGYDDSGMSALRFQTRIDILKHDYDTAIAALKDKKTWVVNPTN